MSRAERCRDEARQADRLADEAKFADIRLGYQRTAANWRRLAAYFDAMDDPLPGVITRTPSPKAEPVLTQGFSGETEARSADREG